MSEEIKTEEELEEQTLSELDELEAHLLADDAEEEEEEQAEEAEESSEEEQQSEEQEESEEENSEEEDNRESTEEESTSESTPRDNAAWAKMRHKMKEMEQKLAEKEAPAPQAKESAKQAVDKLVKVWESGDGNDKPMLTTIRSSTSRELTEIYTDAVAGKYGEHGDDVIKMVQQEMPIIQARESQASQDAQSKREAVRKEFDNEVDMAKTDYPDFADAESDGGKFYAKYLEGLAGKIDDSGKHDGGGELPEALSLYLHSHPYVAHQLADKVYKSHSSKSEGPKVIKLQKEVDSLKQKLLKYESPATPSGIPVRGGNKTAQEMSLEDLDKAITS